MAPGTKRLEKINYSILASQNFRANTNYTIALTIHDAPSQSDEAILVKVSIEDENRKDGKSVVQRFVAMNPNITEVVSIPVGDVPNSGKYSLVIKGHTGCNMEHRAPLRLETKCGIIFIQTDKGIYKPNDCVKFRVLVLNLELKAAPIEDKSLKIDITVSHFFSL